MAKAASQKQIVIGIDIPLTATQQKNLQKAIHKAVTSQVKKLANASETEKISIPTARAKSMQLTAANTTANLEVSITNTNPGSTVNAILKSETKTVSQSGRINFSNVVAGDIIKIRGESLGFTTITIDVDADPMQLNFKPGNFRGSIFIK